MDAANPRVYRAVIFSTEQDFAAEGGWLHQELVELGSARRLCVPLTTSRSGAALVMKFHTTW